MTLLPLLKTSEDAPRPALPITFVIGTLNLSLLLSILPVVRIRIPLLLTRTRLGTVWFLCSKWSQWWWTILRAAVNLPSFLIAPTPHPWQPPCLGPLL